MSKGTFFGNIVRDPTSLLLGLGGGAIKEALFDRPKRKAGEAAAGAAAESSAATAAAKAKVASEQAAVSQNQKAKQVAAINTPSRGFGSNSLENLSRSFLLRL